MRPVSRAGTTAVLSALVVGSSASIVHAQEIALAPQLAYSYGENETARSLAMAGATRAVGNGTTAIFSNPANMALTRLYHIEAIGQFTPEVTRAIGGGAIVDSITSSTRIAGGLAFMGGIIDPDGVDRGFIDARAAAAYPVGDRVFLGIGGRYLRMIQDGFGPLDDAAAARYSSVSGGLVDAAGKRMPSVDTLTFDAGVTIKITQSVHLGVAGQNLTHPGHGLLPTTIGAALGYGSESLTLEVDGVADLDSWNKTTARVMAGGEYLAGDHYPIRLGYRFDQGAGVHQLSGGFGYIGQEIAAEVSVRRTLSTTINSTMIAIGLTYHLESSGLTRNRVSGEGTASEAASGEGEK
ncbi:hypothetical protein [Polyangium mundeleinium]|uniref:PorV/PorQ family protein n=1 Tax=Polyangium mundeleinium TaxID=2995306 RepID=A0ABT5F435_9BACT|nr:hypothetical protein [Polyangium mundeleinium]MDC0748756.1 hypothetical protein [Polyangium mundeleinium]